MVCSMTGPAGRHAQGAARVAVILMAAALLAACSAPNPVERVAAADVRCPDLGGSYCARGRQHAGGADALEDSHLAWFLPLGEPDEETNRKIWAADRVDFVGGHDGQLQVTLFGKGQPVYAVSLAAGQFRCGTDTLLLDHAGEMWGAAGSPLLPIVAAGWSDANNLLWKAADGGLRVRKQRRNAGTVMLAIPVRIDEDFQAKFRPAADGCD